MSSNSRIALSTIAFMVATTALAGCGGGNSGSNNVLAPQFQPQVVNNIDDFQFQTTGVVNVTQTLNYQWRNTGTQANVNQACSITSGTATLVLRDSTGVQVYSRSLGDNGTYQTTVGEASAWSMQIVLTNITGTLNFRAQKKT